MCTKTLIQIRNWKKCAESHKRNTLTSPEIVPDPIKSPGLMLQPVIVWWASCCFMVQYMYLKLLRHIVAGADNPSPGMLAMILKNTNLVGRGYLQSPKLQGEAESMAVWLAYLVVLCLLLCRGFDPLVSASGMALDAKSDRVFLSGSLIHVIVFLHQLRPQMSTKDGAQNQCIIASCTYSEGH